MYVVGSFTTRENVSTSRERCPMSPPRASTTNGEGSAATGSSCAAAGVGANRPIAITTPAIVRQGVNTPRISMPPGHAGPRTRGPAIDLEQGNVHAGVGSAGNLVRFLDLSKNDANGRAG